MTFVVRFLHGPEKYPQQQAEQVPGSEDDSCRADDGKDRAKLVHPEEHQGFAHKAVQTGQAQAGQADKHHEARQQAQPGCQTAVVLDLPRMVAFVEHADQKEQGSGRQPVINHLQQAAG